MADSSVPGQAVRRKRRFDLDWIRIAAFGLLILYHIGMVFVPWSNHVKSTHLIAGLEPALQMLNPWRLSLLFVVAGAATRFMASKNAPGALAANRSRRLLVPLLFGMAVIVPPQPYWELLARDLIPSDFLAFYAGRYFAFAKQFCGDGPCLVLPTWNHLWFVAYLWVYTMLAMLLVKLAPGVLRSAERGVRHILSGIGVLALPAVVFALYRLFLYPRFPQTNALVGDWYNHTLYFTMFALGYVIARAEPIWDAMMRARWAALMISIAAFASYLLTRQQGSAEAMPSTRPFAAEAVYGLYQWTCIVAVLGFGRRWITGDSAARRYLVDAVFPYYIVHQSAIIGCAFVLRDWGLSALAEAAIIMAATVVCCGLSYEIVRRIAWLRPLFGLKPATAAG